MSAPSSGGDRLVPTPDIRAAIKGHEADLLDALSVRWREGGRHRREKRQKGRGDVIPPDQHGDGATPRASALAHSDSAGMDEFADSVAADSAGAGVGSGAGQPVAR